MMQAGLQQLRGPKREHRESQENLEITRLYLEEREISWMKRFFCVGDLSYF